MHHLTPRAPPICRKDHPCIERSASHFQLFPLTMGDRRWARAGRAVPPICAAAATFAIMVQTRRTGCSVASSGFEACPPRGRAPRAGRASSGYDLPGGVPGEGCASLAFGLNLGYGRVSPSAS